MNHGGITQIQQGYIRARLTGDHAYDKEKQLAHLQMPRGKDEPFRFKIARSGVEQIISGKSVLKVQCEASYEDANEHIKSYARQYPYQHPDQQFVVEE